MEFGILGPLRVLNDSHTELTIRGGRQRVLLASLLVRAGRPVSVDTLAEYTWDKHPPPGGHATLKSYVMRLRRQLGPQVGERIRTKAPGYLIDAGDELDLHRFERLRREGRQAAASGAWDRAASAFTAALELWRDEPLADVPSDVLRQEECGHLIESRMTVTELWAEAELRAGRARDLVPELTRLARAHPHREGLHGLLMTALYCSGQRTEALGTFLAIRSRLAEDVGVDPGPQLAELHARILADDAALAAATGHSAPDTVTVAAARISRGEARPDPLPATIPRQLPSAVPSFVGRRDELAAISDLAERNGGNAVVISAINGMAGVGKTALAIYAAHRQAGAFPDGQLFVDLHGYTRGSEPRQAGEALSAFLRTLGVPPQQIPEDTEERAALYRQRLADTRTLIVLDNAISESQVRPLLPGSAGCLVLVTSRRRLKGLDDAHVLDLDVLPRLDAIALLRAMAGTGRAAADDLVLAEIAGLCGQLPLALRIAGAMLRHRPAWTLEYLAGLLTDQRQRIGALSDGERDLVAAFDLSYRSLRGACQRLFRFLGLIHGPDLDAYAAAALAGTDPATAARMLEDLTDHNLLLQHAAGRYELHDLIRLYARALADQDPVPERDTALGRLLDYYQHTASRADRVIAPSLRPAPAGPVPAHPPPVPDPETAWVWLRAERSNLLAAFDYATTHAHHHSTLALTGGLATVLLTDGPWSDGIAILTVAARTAGLLSDHVGRAYALSQLGEMRRMAGDYWGATGDLDQALRIYRDLGQPEGQANVLTQLGNVSRLTGDYQAAAGDLGHALRIYRDLGQREGQANALRLLGVVRRLMADLPGATRDLEQALQIYRDLGQREGQVNVQIRLADVRRAVGDYRAAAGDLEQALRTYRDLGQREGQANALRLLGEVRWQTGDWSGALRALEHALQIFQHLGARNDQACALTVLGQVCLSNGDLPGAAHHLEAAIEIFRRIGSPGNEACALNSYGSVITAIGDHPRAHAIYRDALRLARQAHQPDDEATALEGIGEYHLCTGAPEAGTVHLKQALELFQRLGLQPDADRVHGRLSGLMP